MKHLFLHVGMHKTGTSSIQETLYRNRARLAEAGLHYFDGAVNHQKVMTDAFPPGLGVPAVGEAEAAALRGRIAAFLDSVREGTLVISGEGMGRMRPDAVRDMLGLLRARVDRLSAVCFVRPPRAYLSSAAQQSAKAGVGIERLHVSNAPGYRATVEKYQVPGVELLLPVHDRGELVRGCSVATMLRICGASDGLYDELAVHRENASLSRAGVTLILALTAAGLPTKNDGDRHRRMRRWLVDLAAGLPGEKFRMPDAVLDRVLGRAAVRADVAWMEEVLGTSFARFEAPVPASVPEDGVAPEAWARETLTALDGRAVGALAIALRQELAALDGAGAEAFGNVLGWVEARRGGLDAAGTAELAGLLVAAGRRL